MSSWINLIPFLLYTAKLYKKNKLKKESNISTEKIIILVWLLRIDSRLLTGKKPPDDIKVIDKFSDTNDLKLNKFKITKIITVKKE